MRNIFGKKPVVVVEATAPVKDRAEFETQMKSLRALRRHRCANRRFVAQAMLAQAA